MTNCEVVQKYRWSLIICGVDNDVERYRFRFMNSITDAYTELVCSGLHTLMIRLDIIDESRAKMELAERSLI